MYTSVSIQSHLVKAISSQSLESSSFSFVGIAVSLAPALPSRIPSKREGEGLSYSGGGNQNGRQEVSTDQLTVDR